MIKRINVLILFLIFIMGLLFSELQSAQFKIPRTREELEKIIELKVKQIDGIMGIYIKHVESGESLGLNEDEKFQLASVFKIPVLLTLFKQISLGKISLDDRITLETKAKTFGSGLLAHMNPGLNLSINDLLLLMVAKSDNTAADILFKLVTPQAIAEYMQELGLKKTKIDFNTRQLILAYLGLDPNKSLTIAEFKMVPDSFWNSEECLEKQKEFDLSDHDTSTPFEIALLLEKCVKGEIVNREISDKILDILKHHTGAELITRYLPFGLTIARKGGSLARHGNYTVLNDAGIIWLPSGAGHLIICLFGNRLNEIHYQLKDKMGMMIRPAYDYFLEKNKKQN